MPPRSSPCRATPPSSPSTSTPWPRPEPSTSSSSSTPSPPTPSRPSAKPWPASTPEPRAGAFHGRHGVRRRTMRTMDTSADLSERRAGVARLFDLLAPHYDQGGVPWFGPIASRLLELVAPAPGERAADIGCGRGAVTLSLAEAVGHDGHVTAVDLSPAMVELLTTRAVELGVGNIETRVGDSSEVGLESGTYDLVTASLVLFFTPDPLDALSHWVSL
ncbi:MAG: class I SAM-dependent methyltransferase, partial [Dermatophilaceae bacterium]|nr:class I SAM-dependent methyltransferase [Dermatophilaceae bacterium]